DFIGQLDLVLFHSITPQVLVYLYYTGFHLPGEVVNSENMLLFQWFDCDEGVVVSRIKVNVYRLDA
ncbi:MAG: hypothetical protein SCL54_17105, partial [Bacillota bacterium]|nr:hypothetical protein [Bacillota bacterium]